MPHINSTIDSRHLLSIGLVMLKAGPALFYYHDNKQILFQNYVYDLKRKSIYFSIFRYQVRSQEFLKAGEVSIN